MTVRLLDMPYLDSYQRKYNINDDQLEALKFLSSLSTNGDTARVETSEASIITTHCAHIVLTDRHAYKIKRSIKYSYLDMSSLASRERLCKRELEINNPTLPKIYLEVLPITKNVDGLISINGSGEVIEWVLVMNRFSQHRVLDSMAKDGNLSVEIAKQVGKSIVRYHRSLPARNTNDGYERMNDIVDELIKELTNQTPCFDELLLDTLTKKSKKIVSSLESLLNLRAEQGYVKRCHGDLHLRNLVLMEDGPHPFDALEFDERLATIDVFYDLAFVLMDMSHRGLASQQNALLNQYLAHCEPDDLQGLALMPFFLFCRAAIKAMTTAQNTRIDQKFPDPEAIAYLKLALSYLDSEPTSLIAVGGYSGSGKSTIATRIAVEQNAILLDSDVERKAQMQVPENQSLPESSYTAKSAEKNYQRIIEKAAIALSANQTVIVDATFLTMEQRDHIESVAVKAAVPFIGIWLDVPTDILETRIRTRSRNASDATVEVLRNQLKSTIGECSWKRINASDSIDATLERIHRLLSIEPGVRTREKSRVIT